MEVFKRMESNVQSYARSFPVTFERAHGSLLFDTNDNRYLDFLAGAGSLNYGHNNRVCREALIDYIESGGITHGLDMHTKAKASFLETFEGLILKPRNMDYVVQFTGPTGANSVEAAIKLARKVTGRKNVIAFTNGFHGCTLGALALTGNQHHRGGAGVSLNDVTRMPFDGYMGEDIDTSALLEKLLSDASSGVDMPAAIITETLQGEGGLNLASEKWLQSLNAICKKHGIKFIIDDIQAGCGRTGSFFSFEDYDIQPDMVTLSKSLSGYGLPFAVTLIARGMDEWSPGEHNGTFRGNNHAFVTATAALKKYWSDDTFSQAVRKKSSLVRSHLIRLSNEFGVGQVRLKGKGLMQGIDVGDADISRAIVSDMFENGVIIETCGPNDEVVKCFPPLTISEEELEEGLAVLKQSLRKVMKQVGNIEGELARQVS